MIAQKDALEVWLNDDLTPACRVGTLAHDRGQIRFQYEREWLRDRRAFALDPDLSLDEHAFFPKPELGNFGIFLDSSPPSSTLSSDFWSRLSTKSFNISHLPILSAPLCSDTLFSKIY